MYKRQLRFGKQYGGKIEPDIETVFMLPAEAYSYLSSRLVKELARLGGPVKDLVPPLVVERLRAKVG